MQWYTLSMAAPANVFEPDWIVTSDDGTQWELIVEAKLHPTFPETESQLKQYMIEMKCPLGLLATPKTVRLYQDEYLSDSEESVKLVSECAAPSVWAQWQEAPGTEVVPGYDGAVRRYGNAYAYDWRKRETLAGAEFEDAVRDWLKGLTTESGLRSLPADFRREAEYYLVPVLNRGELRGIHPRRA